ncbi:MAG: thioesterase family protein [Gammaproteobacteria bacterium]|nr:thioesterase family protein [Gammaproteobacteria bacterium]
MTEFDRDTAVEQLAADHWRGEIRPGWRIGTVPNGGYVLAIAGRVLSRALTHPDPLTVHILYTAPTQLGPIDCLVDPLRVGGSTSHAALTMRQEGEVKAHVTASYTDIGRLQGESWQSSEKPVITPYEQCRPMREHGVELRQRVNQCYATGGEVFRRGEPDGSGCFNGWLGFADGREPDLLALLLFADAMAPPIFTVYGALQWVPTLELSVSVRGHPVAGPLQARFRCRYLTRGVVEEDGELWDSSGQLVALSRQTSKVRVVPQTVP